MDSDTKTIVDIILNRSNLRSKVLLASFVQFCLENKPLRFWQALLNWSGWAFIHVSIRIPRHEPGVGIVHDIIEEQDTYYWEQNHQPTTAFDYVNDFELKDKEKKWTINTE